MEKIKLYFLTGFLGSGKTTLIKYILENLPCHLPKEKIGLIINEFGQVSIDGEIIESDGIEISQLNDGQIFCSCLSHKFVETLRAYTKLPLSILIVETSGLANPVSLTNMLEDLKKISGDFYEYCGMIDIIDPTTFPTLRKALMAVDEQVVQSDYLILNKTDLLKPGEKDNIIKELKLLNATAPIEETTFGKVSPQLFTVNLLLPEKICTERIVIDNERPKHFLLSFSGLVNKDGINVFLKDIMADSFRIKGIVQTDSGLMHVDVVGKDIQIRPFSRSTSKSVLVVISAIGTALQNKIKLSWERNVSVPINIKENVFNPVFK